MQANGSYAGTLDTKGEEIERETAHRGHWLFHVSRTLAFSTIRGFNRTFHEQVAARAGFIWENC
jgi:hypothetical protein